ncbi:MAG: hypothetical protein M3252_04265 [Actinomycetota bacterium]|nr:hypothetical protein [Actinomycetota bacterium]
MTTSGDNQRPLYKDRWVTCTSTQLTIHGYYFPSGSPKTIPLARIRHVKEVEIGPLTGQWRIWGTASPRYWAHLDLQRPYKTTAFVLDVGGFVRPWITPGDPDLFRVVLGEAL